MAEETNVHIVEWPQEPARLEHHWTPDQSLPMSISFGETPVNIEMASSRERPLFVNMLMNLVVKESIPLCIKLCEPLCARSEYNIGITIFDRPVASITIRGTTRLFACNEER